MLVLDINDHVRYIDVTGPDGAFLRLMPWDVPWENGQVWPLVVGGQRIGQMIAFGERRVGFANVPRCWEIVRSNARVRVQKGDPVR